MHFIYHTGNKISDLTPITNVGLLIRSSPFAKSDFSASLFTLNINTSPFTLTQTPYQTNPLLLIYKAMNSDRTATKTFHPIFFNTLTHSLFIYLII